MAKHHLLPLMLLFASVFVVPAAAQKPPAPSIDAPATLKPGDAFGEEVTLPERTIIYLQGHSKWDSAVDSLVEAFKTLDEYMDKRELKPAQKGSFHRRERGLGEFSRMVQLPVDLDVTKAQATSKNGIITLRIPKREEAKPRHITVQAA